MSLLEVEDVCAGYGDLQVLWDVSVALPTGGIVVVAGPNGAGKSTLLRTIAGTIRPTAGTIRFDGTDVTRWRHSRRLNSGIGWVPEGRLLFDEITVEENLRMSARMAGLKGTALAESLDATAEVFPELLEWLPRPAGQLSGGQQQIVAIARALVRRPRLMLLDEPSVGIAPRIVGMMADKLQQMSSLGVGILVAEQNVAWLADIATESIVLRGGRVAYRADGAVLASRDFMRDVYLSVGPAEPDLEGA